MSVALSDVTGSNMKCIAASLLAIVMVTGSIKCEDVDKCPLTIIMSLRSETLETCVQRITNGTTDESHATNVKYGALKLLKLDTLVPSNVKLTDDEKNEAVLSTLCYFKVVAKRLPNVGATVFDCIVNNLAGDTTSIFKCVMDNISTVCGIRS